MIITYTDGTSDNLGNIGAEETTNDYLIFSLLEDNTYGVALNTNYTNSVIENINIPSTYKGLPVTIIRDNAFKNSKIESINIPDSITVIGNSAFENCKNITAVTLPKCLKTIGSFAFCYTSLEYIFIPESVTVIGAAAFARTELKTADFENKTGWNQRQLQSNSDDFHRYGNLTNSADVLSEKDLSVLNAASRLSRFEYWTNGSNSYYLYNRFFKM
ncbi:MAG TPA: hypothetical protein DD413_04645 [Ruminococcus sp.]|nr:hypothetical protein [Ruminococcus sp.]